MVNRLLLRSRGALVAVVVLVLSAGAAFAASGPPPAADFGLTTAGEAAHQVVPVRPDAQDEEDATQGDEGVDENAPTATETEDANDPAEAPTADGQGALVSAAAQMETPTGFVNHGEFVSCVARLHKDPAWDPATFDLTTLTVDACRPAAEETTTTDSTATGTAVHGKSALHSRATDRVKTHGRPSR